MIGHDPKGKKPHGQSLIVLDAGVEWTGPTDRRRCADVLGVIIRARADGATDSEIGSAASMPATSVSRCLAHLVQLGLIVDSGLRRSSSTSDVAVVWLLPKFAAHRMSNTGCDR